MLVTLYLVVSLACKFPIILPCAFLVLIGIKSGFHKYPLMRPKRLECDVTQYIDPVCLSPQLLRIDVIHRSQVHVVSFTRCDTSFNFHPSLQPRVHFAGGELYYFFMTGNLAPYPLSSLYHSLLPSFLFCGHFCIYKTLKFLLFCTIRPMFTLSRLVTLVALPGYSCHRCSFTFRLFLSLYPPSVAHAGTGVIVSLFQSCVCNRYNFHPPSGSDTL